MVAQMFGLTLNPNVIANSSPSYSNVLHFSKHESANG